MPIESPSSFSVPVFYPETNYKLVKYLNLTKFISLLQRNSLFFCRLDKLEDKFEGITAKPNLTARISWRHYLRDEIKYFEKNISDEEIIKNVESLYDLEKKIKNLNCVNCWNKGEEESVALWKIYSDFSQGIMIKSSVSQLEEALKQTEEKILLSEIHYLDYEREEMLDGNTMWPIIHKHLAYSYESEVRLVFEVDQVNWIHDWSKEEVPEGVFIKLDIDKLIDEIIIGPHSPEWFLKLVREISYKYGLNKPIKKSILS